MFQANRLGVGDAVGICTNEEGELVVEYNSQEVKQATVRPTYGAAVTQRLAAPPPGKAESFSTGRDCNFFHVCQEQQQCLVNNLLIRVAVCQTQHPSLVSGALISLAVCWKDDGFM